jgi:hypothetical protein
MTDQLSLYRAEQDAQRGSKALLDAMQREFEVLAMRRGLDINDARLFLMNAEMPRRKW